MKKQIFAAFIGLLLLTGSAFAFPNVGPQPGAPVFNGVVNGNGGVQSTGSLAVVASGTPATGTVTVSGTPGSTTYTYYCVGLDANFGGAYDGLVYNQGETKASSSFTTTTGNATLSSTNFNTVFCPGQAGAVGFRVLKADTSHSLGTCYTSPGAGCSVVDNTTGAGTAYTVNTVDYTGAQTGGIAGCGGQVTVSAGTILVTAPCISNYTECSAVGAGASTPVLGNLAVCNPTSTATVIGSATSTVGAVAIKLAATATATINWWAGPQ